MFFVDIKGKNIAVIGASNNPEKYGNKVLKAVLRVAGNVFPVNPNESEILGKKVFSDVNLIPGRVDIAVFVVPPKVTLSVLKTIKNNGIHFWFQPGSFDDAVISYCKTNALSFTDSLCIILESDRIYSNES